MARDKESFLKTKQLFISLTLGLGLTLALLWLLSGGMPSAHADSPHYVAPDCTGVPAPCHATIQEVVDAAVPGDEILVASGIYTGVSARAGVTQMVYISKAVTVRGGYITTNWTTPYPITQPTTLDAQGRGRVLYITGDMSPTIEGLRITGGNAVGLGGGLGGQGAGGGVYVLSATATISDNQVFSNTADHGGGLFLSNSAATLSANTVISNTADYNGGGLSLWYSDAKLSENTVASNNCGNNGGGLYLFRSGATLSRNTISGNTASDWGGGLCLQASEAMLRNNIITANVSGNKGGGLYLFSSPATLNNTIVSGNTAYSGGGIYLSHSDATLSENTVMSNSAEYGGGVYLWMSDATLTNAVVASNQTGKNGSGLCIFSSSPCLLHTTIARNIGGDGSGIFVGGDPGYRSTAAITNTILVSHSVGISVTGGNTVTVNGVLWYGTPVTVSQAATATVAVQNQHEGNPAFAADGYHLTGDSAAIDQGVNAGVTTDIDGQSRDPIPDLGADEFVGVTPIYLPLIMRQYQ